MISLEILGTYLAAFLTLCIYSFLYKDNPFYKLAEHIFAGISAGYYIGLVWHSIIKQQLVNPLIQYHQYLLVIPGILGILMFTRFIPKISWISRFSLAFVIGNTAGITLIQQLHGIVLPQTRSTFTEVSGFSGLFMFLSGLVVIVGVISTLIYFYFSKEHKGVLGFFANVGIVFIMVAFGASFGYTVMARVSLLIGRAQFLLIDWLGVIK
ncbi:MAG: hypothetical protein AMJ90_01585 [candidate division Zixibacteria bacterium SM23_73_2]|nr:MAG: hypothetical protein AMJ90_01585 [candidate division Zixibacteria bacterium SM23_73_2]